MKNKGIYFALATALVSGFSVFLNKFAQANFTDAYVFTTLKNVGVAILIVAVFLFPKIWQEIKGLTRKQWGFLILVGIIGGSIPFLLFFKGLTLTSAINAAFIHKTLFIWVSFLAWFFLREKFGKLQILALGLILAGNILLGGLKSWNFGVGELMIFGATLFWSIEYIFAKKLLKNLSPEMVAWGRMFIGAIVLLLFLVFTNRAEDLFSLNLLQWKWLALSSILLFAFVVFWYRALKLEPASIVTCFLVPASLITTILQNIFVSHQYSPTQLLSGLAFVGALTLLYLARTKARKYETEAAKTI